MSFDKQFVRDYSGDIRTGTKTPPGPETSQRHSRSNKREVHENDRVIPEKMIEIIFHIDKYLDIVIKNFGKLVIPVAFYYYFCETGLVIAPILPGDSLLFAVGALSALGSLNLFWLLTLLTIAAINRRFCQLRFWEIPWEKDHSKRK